ncbi:unnamed protein product [Rotaria magnacalcarata]|uniref:EGF-like domain-containing protein n=5 Tax=Rotaria magnacalcarata TaxID=392030 RepID=A0A819Q5N3_9BILA|nr:unnamed protein product [Rotaria magnacalcarata]
MLFTLIGQLLLLFSGCNDKAKASNSSAIFYCPITKKVLSYHRVKDGFIDCHLGFDETFNGSNCVPNSHQQFRCWTTFDECISLRLVQDNIPHCSDKTDEFYTMECYAGTEYGCDYKRGLYQPAHIYYQFSDLCNGREIKPSLIHLINGTDETDCEDFWCLSSLSIRCNGYWECADGRDELNCSLDSLPATAKSAKLLHILNGCNATEHFCLHISNRSRDLTRSCISSLLTGDGHVDCWGASDERHAICDYRKTGLTLINSYRCTERNSECVPVSHICDGDHSCPMGEDEKVCDWITINKISGLFYCRNGSEFVRHYVQCNGKLDCADGEDEWFCDLELSAPKETQLVEINIPFYPADLQNINMKPISHAQTRYFGERCENQQERISIILQIVSSSSLQRDIAIKLILYLVDIASLKILAYEEVLLLPYIHSSYKHLVLVSSARAQHSFVRIDWYEINMQRVIGYRASWKFNLSFPFLPVRRLAVRLGPFNDEHVSSRTKFTCNLCIHGQCLSYQNSDDVFCRCYNGWTGVACNETFHCALGAISLNSHRCLCPMNRYGTRCFIQNIVVCRWLNEATCLPLDVRSKRSTCLCSGNYFGQYCEQQYANLTIRTFDTYQPKVLPIVLIQFVRITSFGNMLFENIFLFENISTSHSLVIHHIHYEYLPSLVICKVFYSSSIGDHAYYIIFQMPYRIFLNFKVRRFETQLETSQKCADVRKMEIFKKPVSIIAYPYMKRIKYYHRACAEDESTSTINNQQSTINNQQTTETSGEDSLNIEIVSIMCRSYSDDFKRSSSSSPAPIHQQFIQPPPPPYTTASLYTLEGCVAFLEAMPAGSLSPILVQRLAAAVASQAASVGAGAAVSALPGGAGVAALPAGAVSATPHHETPAPPSQ